MVRTRLWVLMMAGWVVSAHAQGSESPPPPTYKADSDPASGDDARTSYIRRALNPVRPPELAGLREYSLGTGFVVTPRNVLTNAHVVRECVRVSAQIGGSGGDLVIAPVEAADTVQDLAILRLDKPAADQALFEANFARVDPEEMYVVGFPSEGLPVVRPELTTATARPGALATLKPRLEFNGVVRHGNSGSPLFDNFGAVVGIVTQAVDSPKVYSRTGLLVTDIGIAVANHVIVDFLRKHAVQPQIGERRTPMSEADRMPEAKKIVARLVCWR